MGDAHAEQLAAAGRGFSTKPLCLSKGPLGDNSSFAAPSPKSSSNVSAPWMQPAAVSPPHSLYPCLVQPGRAAPSTNICRNTQISPSAITCFHIGHLLIISSPPDGAAIKHRHRRPARKQPDFPPRSRGIRNKAPRQLISNYFV